MQDCSLFVVGSHQKKRPHNYVMGRIFNGSVLDMFEFGVLDYKSMDDLKAKTSIPSDMKPLLIFQGEPFEMNEAHKRMKNLFIDFFKMSDSQEINVVEMKRIIVFTCQNNTAPIVCKQYEAGTVKEGDVK